MLSSEKPVIATVALKGSGFIADVEKRTDVTLIEVTMGNRDALIQDLLARIIQQQQRIGQPQRVR